MPPLLGSLGADPAKAYGFFSSSLGASYYVAYYNTDASYVLQLNTGGLFLATTGELYYTTYYSSYPTKQIVLSLLAAGSLNYQYSYTASGSVDIYPAKAALDSSNNLYLSTQVSNSSGLNYGVHKTSSTGTSVSFSGINLGTTSNVVACGACFDSSGNFYISGWLAGTGQGGYVKFNSSMTLQAQNRLTTPSSQGTPSICVDSSGNIYLSSYAYIGGQPNAYLIKYTSAGAISWSYTYVSGSNSSVTPTSLPIDSSGNVYMIGTLSGGASAHVTKIDSTGTVVWAKSLTSGTYNYPLSAYLDPSGTYLYMVLYCGNNPYINKIIKMDLSGAIIWERQFSSTTATNGAYAALAINANSYAVLTNITVSSVQKTIIGKFPTDGTKTGTYSVGGQTLSYSVPSSTTVASITMTRSTLSATTTSPGASAASSSMTRATPTLTVSTTAV